MTTAFPELFDVQWERLEDEPGAHMRVLPGQRTPGTTTDFFKLPAGSYMLTGVFRGTCGGAIEAWVGNSSREIMDIPVSESRRERLVGTIYFSTKTEVLVRPWIESPGSVQTVDDMFTLKVVPFPTYSGI